MNKLLLKSIDDRHVVIGQVLWNPEASQITMSLGEEYDHLYRPVLISMISDIEAKGGFGISLDKKTMTIDNVSEMYWEALIQTLFKHLSIAIGEES